jgi:hypothetical protein
MNDQVMKRPADTVEVSGATATARVTTRIAADVLEAGTLAAQCTIVSAMRRGRAVVRRSSPI